MDIKKNISNIIEENMMGYSQYVIKNRALPDLYSGMKPIHAKILWTMYENKIFNFTKSANVSGKVMVYSPHGDCYETIVNMVQKDRHIYNLIEGQGNWGSACSTDMQYAASRYTECKLSKLGIDCMEGISSNMVEMIDNYDSSSKMPKYIPTRFPLILCMAGSGIAVGMGNSSPSFNLEEVCNATISYLKNEEIPVLIPDFATGGELLYNKEAIEDINLSGKGSVTLMCRYKIENNIINIYEIPYGTKSSVENIISKIIDRCKKGELKEVTGVLNQTGINGLSIEITCRKTVDPEIVIKKLLAFKILQCNFNCNMNVLVKGSPIVMGVHDVIKEWVKFRQQCIINKIQFDINKLQDELHLMQGLKKVLLDVDRAVNIIRYSNDIEDELMEYFKIDKTQTNNIMNMKLKNINKDYIIKQISEIENMELELNNLKSTIINPAKINNLIILDLQDVIKKFKQPRRTIIIEEDRLKDVSKIDVIPEYNCKILFTKHQYIKKILKSSDSQYMKDGDEIIEEIPSTNRSTLLLFTNKANRYKISCYELEEKKPSNLGEYLHNILELENEEEVIKVVSIDENKPRGYIVVVFENGKIAKINLRSFISANKKLQNCHAIESKLITIEYIEKDCDVLMISAEGKGLIINTDKLGKSKSSRNSQGNQAMKINHRSNNKIINAIIDPSQSTSFTLITKKDRIKDYYLDDIASNCKAEKSLYEYIQGSPNTQGNFILNTRVNDDEIIKMIVNN